METKYFLLQSINFNNVSADSFSQVTIHKRNNENVKRYRKGGDDNSPDNSFESPPNIHSDNELPKKKKYKIVPNSFTSPPPAPLSQSILTTISNKTTNSISNGAQNITSSLSTASKFTGVVVNKTEPAPIKTEADELPKDRKDLLKFVSQQYHSLFSY